MNKFHRFFDFTGSSIVDVVSLALLKASPLGRAEHQDGAMVVSPTTSAGTDFKMTIGVGFNKNLEGRPTCFFF